MPKTTEPVERAYELTKPLDDEREWDPSRAGHTSRKRAAHAIARLWLLEDTRARRRPRTFPRIVFASLSKYISSVADAINPDPRERVEQILEELLLERMVASLTELDDRMGAFNERMRRRLDETEHLYRRAGEVG